jgi:integrase
LFLTAQNDKRSGCCANKDRKHLSTAWTWGKENLSKWDAEANPFKTIQRFKEEREPRYVPPEEDFWAVYDSATDQQDKTMLLAYLHLAGRRTEIFKMKRNDLDFQNKRARLWTAKRDGGKEYDWLPMTEELTESLSAWWKRRMEMGLVDNDHLFICLDPLPCNTDSYGKPFTKRGKFLLSACKQAGVIPFSFHAIRHLTASILFHRGYGVSHIQLVMRHKSPNTTEQYLKSLGLESVREAMEMSLSRKVISLDEIRMKKAQNETI